MAVEIRVGKYEFDTETGKIAPTDEELMRWFLWVNEHTSEFEQKYPGKHLAIWDCEIIGVGDGKTVYEEARRRRPDVIPYIIRAHGRGGGSSCMIITFPTACGTVSGRLL